MLALPARCFANSPCHLVQFLESFANKSISSSEDRLEETKRRKLAIKCRKLVELMMVSGIPTSSGFEERIRFAEMEIVDRDAIDTGVLNTMPQGNFVNGWDVNVAGVHITTERRNIRQHKHAVSCPVAGLWTINADKWTRNSFCACTERASWSITSLEGMATSSRCTSDFAVNSPARYCRLCPRRTSPIQTPLVSSLEMEQIQMLQVRLPYPQQTRAMGSQLRSRTCPSAITAGTDPQHHRFARRHALRLMGQEQEAPRPRYVKPHADKYRHS